MVSSLAFFYCLLVKHTIIDWCLQNPWQYQNKGNLKHPGGYFHAFLNALGSLLVILLLGLESKHLPLLLLGEYLSHYAMDWSKVNICKKMKWTATTSEYFWMLTGFDQFVHLSYLVLMAKVICG
jgi:uncharacterized SAM-binding protein YcdF (DUF218 family)